MQYNAPPGSQDSNAPYVNGIPGVQKGSPVNAHALEYTQREIVSVIQAAGLTPTNNEVDQLLQAINRLFPDIAHFVPNSRKITTNAPLKGGGSLSQDLTLSVEAATTTAKGILALATNALAQAGTDAATAVTPAALKAARPGLRMFFAQSSGSFTVPAGVFSILVVLTGGGGSGPNTNGYEGCGGSAGGTCMAVKSVTPGQAITYTIGAGGQAPNVAPGNTDSCQGVNGGASSCLGMTAGGGPGGRLLYVAGYGDECSPLVKGGAASGATINMRGGVGAQGRQNMAADGKHTYYGGKGGDSFWGGGGQGSVNSPLNNPVIELTDMHGSAPGAGGGARCVNATVTRSGNGAPGCIMILY